MPIESFPDAEEHLRCRHSLARVRTFCAEIAAVGPRAVTVRVERLRGLDRWWFGLSAAICPETHVHAASALRYNARLALGALAASEGTCWLRAVLPSPIEDETLDETVAWLGEEAARILDLPDPAGGELFSNLY